MTPHDRLERSTWDLFWLPPEARVIDRPELLAIGIDREVGYLNCVYRTRADPPRLPALIDEVTALHRPRTSRWSVVDTVDPQPLMDALTRAGYERGTIHDARIVAVDRFIARPSAAIEVRRVTDAQTLRDCWHVMDAAFGAKQPRDDDALALELSQCGPPGSRIQRYVAYLDGEPVSSGGLNVYPQLGIALLWAGGTVPSARGRGAYSAVVSERVARAAALGIEFVGLYARQESSSPIVAAQGFDRHGTMIYFTQSLGSSD